MEVVSQIRSVDEFLQRVRDADKQPDTAVTLFRGQIHPFPLLPKLFRANKVEDVQRYEEAMLDSLKTKAPHLRPSKPENDWDWLSLGQHYGMSTRMSDWSANPIIALFFAVEEDVREGRQPLVYQYPVRSDYMADKKTSPLRLDHTRVMKVETHSHRAAAQAAWQIIHAIHHGGDSYSFIPLGQMPPHDTRMTQIAIDPGRVPALRNELAQWGLDHSTVYGEFGWVCRSIAPSFGLT